MAHRRAPQADSDLDDIWYYVATRSDSLEIADSFVQSITDRFILLAANPGLGRARSEDLSPHLRTFPVGEYVIVYRIEGEDVLILRVIHGRRNIEALFVQ